MLVLLVTVSLFAGILFLMLQTKPVKTYLTDTAETWFNQNYHGTITIGEIGGILPLHAELKAVTLEFEGHTPASFESLQVSVDLIGLLRNHITIQDISIRDPQVRLSRGESGNYTLTDALQKRREVEGDADEVIRAPFQTIDIYAPFVQIYEGAVFIDEMPDNEQLQHLPSSLTISDINTELFLEISADQRYLDITYLTLQLDEIESLDFILSGQIYNDSRYFEFNAMNMQLGDSYLDWDSEFTGIDLFAGNFKQQFRDASWSFILRDAWLAPQEANLFAPDRLTGLDGLHVRTEAAGDHDRLRLTNTELISGDSHIQFQAEVTDYRSLGSMSYVVDLHELDVNRNDLENMVSDLSRYRIPDLQYLTASGFLQGDTGSVSLDLEFFLPDGSVLTEGSIGLAAPYSADINLNGRDIDWVNMNAASNWPTSVNFDAKLTANKLATPDYELLFDLKVIDSWFGELVIPEFEIDGEYAGRILSHSFIYKQGDHYLNGEGHIDFRDSIPNVLVTGESSGFNLQEATQSEFLPLTTWNMTYDINWNGFRVDDWYGRIIVDVFPSVVNGSELRAHQMYLDMNHPDSEKRSLRLTSSMLDLLVEGEVPISALNNLYQHWQGFFTHRVDEEFLFQPGDSLLADSGVSDDVFSADFLLELKDMELLKAYLSDPPEFASRASLSMNLHLDRDRFEVMAQWQDSHTNWEDIRVDNSRVNLNAEFHYDSLFRKQQHINLDLVFDRLNYQGQDAEGLSLLVNVHNDSLYSRSRIGNYGNNMQFSAELNARLADSQIRSEISELIIGNEQYLWHTEGRPAFIYTADGKLEIEQFSLVSGSDQVFVDGVISSSPDDSMSYRFANVDLDRISQMIGGRVNFEGELNADFVTKTLFENPVLHGDLMVDQLFFDNRIIGDVRLNSSFNPERDRFDTELRIYTDPEKYSEYFEHSNGIRQDITATGWLKAPEMGTSSDSLFYFDINAEEVDTWVLTYILDTIFDSIEGKASGQGYITGNLNYVDFDANFELDGATVQPVFFETEYQLSGPVSLSRSDGVELNSISVRDRDGGTGTLSGNYDFNDFQAEKFMNIQLSMNNLLFMNNSDGPDVPFFGSVAGTGVVAIEGSNVSPYVRTIEPVFTTSRSRFAIPLAEQGTSSDQGRFIRFVKEFRDLDIQRVISDDPEVLRQIDRSFMEVFRLDLQFIAAQNSTVQLIFDPVTGEIVNARGEGRVRITLEDESLQIFGNFNVTDGDYLFVGGDILTRRFNLREGGSIRWDGDPANALLDITAVYRARPNIAPLIGGATDQTNRIPVELLLEITGPIDNIENDFYFEFPNAIDATQNAAVLNVLNSEEQKLIQATSLLFTGGFISGGLVGDTQAQELGSTLQARAGQVGISQLLSSQINALLSDNLINLDVDLNLFGFDQADLGIALRLFDDRLVLRREGEVGGQETDIGDLGATYRINPNLSVEVFRRKDPMLMSIIGAQADVENVNGVGLEAQFRFNSWSEFGDRIWHNVSTVFGLFGRDEDEPEMEEASDPEVASQDE